jgi:hypothetical protein
MLPVLRVRWIKREEGLDSVLYFYFLAGICERFQRKLFLWASKECILYSFLSIYIYIYISRFFALSPQFPCINIFSVCKFF